MQHEPGHPAKTINSTYFTVPHDLLAKRSYLREDMKSHRSSLPPGDAGRMQSSVRRAAAGVRRAEAPEQTLAGVNRLANLYQCKVAVV